MNDHFSYFENYINENKEACRESAVKVRAFIKDSTAYYHGEPVKTLYIPKIFSEADYEYFKEIGKTTYGILKKITERYLSDPDYRKLFPYPKDLEELVLFERGYESIIPICRLDIFYNEEEKSFKFCEINTDGTSAMNEDRELYNALCENIAFKAYAEGKNIKGFELFESWAKRFLKIYKDWAKKEDLPYVAIVDFLKDTTTNEVLHFKKTFEALGCECELAEIEDLKYENGELISPKGKKIDAIYRRAVTTDIYANKEKVGPFIKALKEKAACCIGNFCTQVAHNKAMFKIIRDEETLSMLTEKEKEFVLEHFPFTGYLNSESTGTELTLDDVIATKDRWLLKPLDLYGAREINVGSDLADAQWETKVKELADKGYIFQEYCYPYRTRNINLDEDDARYSDWINMTGLYMYDGELAGLFSRVAPDKVIAGHYGGRTLVSLVEYNS